jgi:tetratricopeptide (TPR) repeat protein
MLLCSDNDHQIQTLFQYMKNEFGTGGTNVLVFGHVLRKMGKFDYAEKYYRRFLDQISANDANSAHDYHALGLLADDKGDYASSLNSIAIVHQRKGEYTLALESYEKAFSI